MHSHATIQGRASPLSADILQYYLACSPRASNPFQQVRAQPLLSGRCAGPSSTFPTSLCCPSGPLMPTGTLRAPGHSWEGAGSWAVQC